MHGLLKQPGYRLYAPGSPEARALLAEQGLGLVAVGRVQLIATAPGSLDDHRTLPQPTIR